MRPDGGRLGFSEPPGPQSAYPGQILLELRRNPLTLFDRLAREYGDVVRVPVPFRPIALLSHPDHVRALLVTHAARFGRGLAIERSRLVLGDGLLTSDGDRHRRHRRLMQPSFSRQEIERHVPAVAAIARAHQRRWRQGETIDVSTEMATLTMSAMARVLFGEDIDASVDEAADALGVLLEFSDRLMLPFSTLWTSLPLPSVRRARAALATLDRLIFDLIAAKRRRGAGTDVLSALIQAVHADDPRHRLTDQELRDQTMTLLLAGHETTASALAWTWHALSAEPDAHDAMAAEAGAVLGERAATAADLERLVFVEQVLAESMRLYPPVWSVGRRALADVEIDGHRIAAGTLAVVSQWVIHRDARFWADPARFNPARFASGDRARRPRPSYFPFGDGFRRCIGESLAWMVGVTVLATLAPRVRFEALPNVAISPMTFLFLLYPGHRPAGTSAPLRRGLPMRVAVLEA